ncbi:hypothetical protein EC988_005391, partial [Linderina pennispora]
MVVCSAAGGMLSQSLLSVNDPSLESISNSPRLSIHLSKDTLHLHHSQSTQLFPTSTTTIPLSTLLTRPPNSTPQHPDTDPPASPTTLKPKRSILRAKIGLLGRQSPRSPEHAPMSARAERVPMVTARVYPVVEIDKRSEEISLPQSPPMSIRSVQATARPHVMSPVYQPTDHNDMHSGNSARSLHVHGFQKTRAQPPIQPVHSTQSDEDPLEQGSSRITVDSSEESETCNATHGTTVDSSMPFIPLKSSAPNVEAADMADKLEDDDMPLGELARSSNESSAVSPMAIDEESAENGSETPVRQARKITDANLVSDMDFKDSPATASPTIAHIDSLFQMADENMAAAQQVQMKHDGEDLSPRLSLRLSANASTFNNFNISAFAPSTEPIIESAEASLQGSEDSPRAAPASTVDPEPESAENDTNSMASVASKPVDAEEHQEEKEETPALARLRSLRARRLGQAVTASTASDPETSGSRRFRATQTLPKAKHVGQKPLSKMGPLQLDRLTKLNTRRNSTYLTCKIEKYTVEKEGDRPPSPSSMMQERALLRRVARGEINEDGDYIYASGFDDDDSASDVSMASTELPDDTVGLGVANLPVAANAAIHELVETRPLTPADDLSDTDMAVMPGSGRALLEGFQEAGP